MTKRLTSKDILALGFMTFALFVGAGNIIFPPMVGLQSGQHVWLAAAGFLITAVGLPVITVIALARVGGGIDALSSPIGQKAGLLLAVICYLAVGPLFATPRTATVSFAVGVAPFAGNGELPLLIYSLLYFALVISISLYPGRLLDTVGHVLAPLKIIALAVLGIAAMLWPAGQPLPVSASYSHLPFSSGFVNGYLTMDTLGAMVFGIVIVNAARARGVTSAPLLTRYAILAGLIAGIGLTAVYLTLFKLRSGSGFLTVLITIACLVTAVGLNCACAEFFSEHTGIGYGKLVFFLGLFSMVVSNLGLSHLISISVPVLTAIYPPCIVLILLSFTLRWWHSSTRLIAPGMLVSLVFGCLDGIKVSAFPTLLPAWVERLPLSAQGLAWLPPTLFMLIVATAYDQTRGRQQISVL